MDLDRAADRRRHHRVFVVVEAHQAGLGDGDRQRMEPVEGTAIRHQRTALFLEHLADRPPGLLDMAMRLGPGDATVEQPGIQFVIGPEAQPRREEAFAHQADLVLDLTLLPA